MLLVLRIVTSIVSLAWLIAGFVLVFAGLADSPGVDWEAVILGAGISLCALANFYLLYRSYKKKHAPTHWVAFILAILPAVIILVIIWLLDNYN